MEERELNLIDMAWDIVAQWRKIIVFIIIGIVLTLGYQSVSILNKAEAEAAAAEAAAAENKDYSEAIKYAKSQLTNQEALRVEILVDQKSQIENLDSKAEYLKDKRAYFEDLPVNNATDAYYKNNLIISAIDAETAITAQYNQIRSSLAGFTDPMLYYYYLLDDPDNYEKAYAKVYRPASLTNENVADSLESETLTEIQQAYVDAQEANSAAQAALAAIPATVIDAKNIILGILVGIFIAMFVLAIAYILSSKLKFIDNIESSFKIPGLAKILTTEPKLGIDKWIQACRYRKMHPLTQPVAVSNMTSLIKLAVDKSEANNTKIAILGGKMTGICEPVIKELTDSLKSEGLDVELLPNLLYDSVSLKKLGQCQFAVAIETAGVDTYDMFYNELQLLNRNNIEVIGAAYIQ